METNEIIRLIVEIACIVGVCLFVARKTRRAGEPLSAARKPAKVAEEIEKLTALRARRLSTPLSELTRPSSFQDIVGQKEGIRALMAAVCGPNPQHVLLYGPPGVGKTCAARLVLEAAKKRPDSPFNEQSAFIEMDATCIRFDERAIADPLIGSVHDPIYQGAGALGSRGVPQPKPGAVTRAHCGILFLDEIGELHPMQMNKLLKVLEDRRVRFESAYYSPENTGIPPHIKDIFENGLPADFRLIGATTRSPEDLPPALRSRCVELHFTPLSEEQLMSIAMGAAERAGRPMTGEAGALCARYAGSGRDAVNIAQLCAGLAYNDARPRIEEEDVIWVARTCNYAPHITQRIDETPRVGVSNMLAVTGSGLGVVMELECVVKKGRRARLTLSGIVEGEELEQRHRRLSKKSTARCSVENVMSAVSDILCCDLFERDVHFNIPGGLPADGPSAGVALALALYSAATNTRSLPMLAGTGEITIHGDVRPVGGVRAKVLAAKEAGAKTVFIPKANDESGLHALGVQVLPVLTLSETLSAAFPAIDPIPSTIPSQFTDCAILN